VLEAVKGAIDLPQIGVVQLLPLLVELVLISLSVVFKLAHEQNFAVRVDLQAFFGECLFNVLLQAVSDARPRCLLLYVGLAVFIG